MDTLKVRTHNMIRPLLQNQHSRYTDEDNSETEMTQTSKSSKEERSNKATSPRAFIKNKQSRAVKQAKSMDEKSFTKLSAFRPISRGNSFSSSSLDDMESRSSSMGEEDKENIDTIRKRKRSNTICSLNSVVYCPICSDTLEDPKMLPCQHTFCLKCLKQYCKSEKSKLSCPTCRAEIPIPSGGLESLPSNIAIQCVLDALRNETDLTSNNKQQCSKCKTKCHMDQTRLCDHCGQMLCMVCWPVHMKNLSRQLQKFNCQFETQDEQILLQAEDFKTRCEKMSEDIKETVREKILNLQLEEKKLQQQLKDLIIKDHSEREDLRKDLHQCKQELQECVKESPTSRSWVQSFLPPQIHFDSDNCKIQESDVHKKLSLRRSSYQIDIDVSSNTDSWAKSVTQRSSLLKPYLQRPALVAFSPWNENEVYVVSTDTHQVHILDRNGGHLRNFGRRGHSKGEFLCPCGIAASPITDEVYVTDKWRHCVLVFNKDGKFLREFGGKGRSPGHLRSPEGIDVTSNGDLYICDTCNDRVHRLNKEGEFISELGKIVSSKHADGKVYRKSEFNEPCDIKVATDGKIVVCDSGNKRIKVYGPDGTHLLTFGNQGSGRGQFNSPTCIAIDREGNMYVGDSGNGRVQVFSPSGSFIRTFGNFSWIRGIAISRNYEIITTDFKSNKVKFFQLE